MMTGQIERFMQAAAALGEAARPLLGAVGEQDMALAGEIRLRVGAPASLSLPAGIKITGTVPVTRTHLEEMVLSLCGHSIYSHQNELAAGYISVPGGHRAGVCGTAVVCDGRITALRDYTSICLRIARDHIDCSDEFVRRVFRNRICSAVIAGAPCTGKTSLLRDTACKLASGAAGQAVRVSVVDERGELSMTQHGGEPDRLGRMCDVLSNYPKAEGIMQAVRSLSPDVIICDELGTEAEVRAVSAGINAGVSVICSIHAGSAEELARKPQTKMLLATGAFDDFALLCGRNSPGKISRIIDGEGLYALGGGSHAGAVRTDGRFTVQRETA